MNPAAATQSTAAVVGGGIVGASIAWRLAQRGWGVTVFERGKLGMEASWAGAGMLAPGGETDEASLLAEMAIESRALYPSYVEELVRESGVAIDYRDCGAIELAYTAIEWTALQARAERQLALGIQSQPLNAVQVQVFSPHVQIEGLTGALFYPGDGVVNPRDVMAALRVALTKRGVDLREDSAVTRVEPSATGVRVSEQSFDAAVIAAGAWSGSVGVAGLPALPSSSPVKGHLLGFDLPLGACPTIVRHQHTYLLQRAGGMLIAGASVENAGFDRTIRQNVVDELYGAAKQIFPVLEKLAPSEVWIGFRPASDALRLGSWLGSRLFLAYGHYRNGILLAPATADRIAAAITSSG